MALVLINDFNYEHTFVLQNLNLQSVKEMEVVNKIKPIKWLNS